jgi:tetratricopeptide (TPR) repeat protein
MANSKPREMDDAIYAQLTAHTNRGNELTEQEQYLAALTEFEQALTLIPEPVEDWEAATWVLASIGDCHFMLRDYPRAHRAFSHAVACPGGLGNWFIHLRLGEIQFELGNMTRAADELARAYMAHGKEAFAHEDPKYYAYLRTKMRDLN